MTQSNISNPVEVSSQQDTSFGDILSEFEQSHHTRGETVDGTVVSITPEAIFVDIGRKMDGVLPPDPSGRLKKGDKLVVSIRGRDQEGRQDQDGRALRPGVAVDVAGRRAEGRHRNRGRRRIITVGGNGEEGNCQSHTRNERKHFHHK